MKQAEPDQEEHGSSNKENEDKGNDVPVKKSIFNKVKENSDKIKDAIEKGAFSKPDGVSKKSKEKEDCEQKIIELEEKNGEITDLLKRTQAEFINFKDRTEREAKNIIEYGNSDFIKKILPVVDTFEIALKNTTDKDKFREGMEMVLAQLFDVLKQNGVEPIECVGKKFDPYLHDVMLKEKSDAEEDMIIQELQKGYMFKGKVLRHSKVKISG